MTACGAPVARPQASGRPRVRQSLETRGRIRRGLDAGGAPWSSGAVFVAIRATVDGKDPLPKPPVLLFDIGGVLVENAGFAALGALLPGAPDEATLKARWLESAAVRAFELGEIAPAVFADRFRAEWGLDLSREAFIAAFLNWPRGFFPGALDLLARLRPRHHVSCLSNSNVLHWEKFGGFAGLFETMHVSHLMGRIKPDPDMFAAAIESLGVDPADIVFFDDSALNVRVGRDAGMRAFHVEGVADVERVLRELKLA